jgi:hypothetical protein
LARAKKAEKALSDANNAKVKSVKQGVYQK